MIWVTDARAIPDYRLWVRFSDATEGEIDLKDFITSDARPIVTALRDQAAFSAIRQGNNLTRPSMVELEAAERFIGLIDSVDMVKFTKNGSTAVSAAVKLALLLS